MKTIGLIGPQGAGKSSVARAAADMICGSGQSAVVVSFARPLKVMIMALLDEVGIDQETANRMVYGDWKEVPIPQIGGATARHLMRTLGTEWGRNQIHPDLWEQIGMGRSIADYTIFDDVRFENEIRAIASYSGMIFEVQRHGAEYSTEHPSAMRPVIPAGVKVIPLDNNGFLADTVITFLSKIIV